MSGQNRSFALPAWAGPSLGIQGPVMAPNYPPPMPASEWQSLIKEGVDAFFRNTPRPFRRVLIMVEDASRPSNTAPVIQYLTGRLQKFLPPYTGINLLVAGGAHAGLESGNTRKIPFDFPGVVRIHDCREVSPASDVEGTPLFLAKEVLEADLRVAVGTVNLHPTAGFSGGAKILTPGCAGLPTIFGLHGLSDGEPGLLETPIRRFAHSVLDRFPVELAIQLLTDELGRILGLFTGELRQAWQLAAETLLPWVSLPLRSPFPSCLVEAVPFDQNLLGIFKALPTAVFALEPGGTAYIHSKAPEGLGEHWWRLNPNVAEKERLRWEERLGNRQIIIITSAQISDDLQSSVFPRQVSFIENNAENRAIVSGLPVIRSAPLLRFV